MVYDAGDVHMAVFDKIAVFLFTFAARGCPGYIDPGYIGFHGLGVVLRGAAGTHLGG